MIAYIIYQDVDVIINDVEVHKELKDMKDYFGSDGDFKRHEEDVIEAMKYIFSLLFNLVAASRAMILQYRLIFLTNMFFMPTHSADLAETVRLFDPDRIGFDQTLYVQVREKLTQANTA